MTRQEVYELVEKAYRANEIKKMFLGKSPYLFDNLKHIPANVPTDIGAILDYGLYVIFEEGDNKVPLKLKSVVFELLDGTPEEIWTAYSICWLQYWNEEKKKTPFQFICPEILSHLQKVALSNKEKLVACKKFTGCNKKEGLWEDIVISNQNFKKRFGVELI